MLQVLTRPEWTARAREHRLAVAGLTAARRARAQHGIAHPVEDFLFRYYPIRPAALRRWHPGSGVVLADAPEYSDVAGYVAAPGQPEGGVMADPDAFRTGDLSPRREHLERVRALLAATARRPPKLSCFGLHEWAMVLGQDQLEVRHNSWPLRVDQATVAATIDEVGLSCTHFDAFRFFTDEARPRNPVRLTRADQAAHEQPGCLHAGMDLYRWAFELLPLAPSALVLRCFAHAADARAVDMRAAPYDLRALGYEPIAVETPAGRAQYVAEQRRLAATAAALRAELLAIAEVALTAAPPVAEPASAGAIPDRR